MNILHYKTIKGRTEEIIQSVMDTPEIQKYPEHDFTFRLVAEEIVCNIVNYAYPIDTDGGLDIEITANADSITISFRDKGIHFDPLAKSDPDVTLPAEERPIGGLGIFLVKQMMDEVTYTYEDNCNILTVKKHSLIS